MAENTRSRADGLNSHLEDQEVAESRSQSASFIGPAHEGNENRKFSGALVAMEGSPLPQGVTHRSSRENDHCCC